MDSIVQPMPHGEWIALYSPWPMGNGYRCTIHTPSGMDTVIQPMGHGYRILFHNPWVMGCTMLHGPWPMELCHDVRSMTHGEKIAEPCALLPITAGVFWCVASSITTLYYASISPIFDTSVPWWLSSPSSSCSSLLPHSSEFPLFRSHLAADLFAKYCLLVTFYCCHLALFDRKSCSWYVVVVCITIQRLG